MLTRLARAVAAAATVSTVSLTLGVVPAQAADEPTDPWADMLASMYAQSLCRDDLDSEYDIHPTVNDVRELKAHGSTHVHGLLLSAEVDRRDGRELCSIAVVARSDGDRTNRVTGWDGAIRLVTSNSAGQEMSVRDALITAGTDADGAFTLPIFNKLGTAVTSTLTADGSVAVAKTTTTKVAVAKTAAQKKAARKAYDKKIKSAKAVYKKATSSAKKSKAYKAKAKKSYKTKVAKAKKSYKAALAPTTKTVTRTVNVAERFTINDQISPKGALLSSPGLQGA